MDVDHAHMSGVADSIAQQQMGQRLRQVRDALEISQQEMAEAMGIVATALSAWENGRNQIDIVKLAKAAERWRFTTDWIALGDLSGVRKDLADKLEQVTKSPNGKPRRGRPSGSRLAACVVELPTRRGTTVNRRNGR